MFTAKRKRRPLHECHGRLVKYCVNYRLSHIAEVGILVIGNGDVGIDIL